MVRVAFRKWSERILYLGLFLAVVPYGSTSPTAFSISSVVLSTALVLALIARPGPLQSPELAVLVGLGCAFTLFAAAQSFRSRSAYNPLQDRSWEDLAFLGTLDQASLSVNPTATLLAIPHLVVTLSTLVCASSIFRGERDVELFLIRLTCAGGVICAGTLLLFVVAPDQVLVLDKKFYRGVFTANFINRNTAATFCGMVAVMASGLLFERIRRGSHPMSSTSLAWAAIGLLALACAGITKSRAGALATFIAVMTLASIYGLRYLRAKGRSPGQLTLAGAAVLAGLALFGMIGAQTLVRFDTNGLESARWCIYSSASQLFKEHWLFGTGFGTFQDVIPSYRADECTTLGYWDYFHSSFLEFLQGGGAIAVIMVMAAGTVTVAGLISRLRSQARPVAAATGISVLLLVCLHSTIDFSLQINGIAVLLAAILGAAFAPSESQRRKSHNWHALSFLDWIKKS